MAKKSSKKKFKSNKHTLPGGKVSKIPLFKYIIRSISWKPVFISVTIVIIGYALLAKADPIGKNIYSSLAPVFLIGGHLFIALSLMYSPKTPHKSK